MCVACADQWALAHHGTGSGVIASPLLANLSYHRAGSHCFFAGMGQFSFQKVTLRRADPIFPSKDRFGPGMPPGGHMMVLNKGRVCHVTASLAQLLGTNPKAMMAATAGSNALEALLVEPFAAMHANLGHVSSERVSGVHSLRLPAALHPITAL